MRDQSGRDHQAIRLGSMVLVFALIVTIGVAALYVIDQRAPLGLERKALVPLLIVAGLVAAAHDRRTR